MNTLSLTRLIAIFVILSASAFGGEIANPFVGKWQIDKSKTKAQGVPDDLQVEIKSAGDRGVLVKSKYNEPKTSMYPLLWVGVMTYELPLSIDGSEKQNQIGPFLHVSKTSLDGNKMTTDWKATIEKGGVEGKWIRTLSTDGRHMDFQIIAQASDGRKMDQTIFFKRR